MAFKAFGSEQANNQQAVGWAEEYLAANPAALKQCWDALSIKLTEKGMLLACDEWKAFVYKNTCDYRNTLEFIQTWHASKQKSPVLQLMLTDYRPHVVLGVDDERFAYWGKQADNSWTQAYATGKDNPKYANNSLPLPSSSSISKQADAPASSSHQQEATAAQVQTFTEQPLEEAARSLNGHKRTKTSKAS